MSNIRYTDQFKKDAARLVIEEGYTLAAAVEAVGVCHTTIKSWVGQYRDQVPERWSGFLGQICGDRKVD